LLDEPEALHETLLRNSYIAKRKLADTTDDDVDPSVFQTRLRIVYETTNTTIIEQLETRKKSAKEAIRPAVKLLAPTYNDLVEGVDDEYHRKMKRVRIKKAKKVDPDIEVRHLWLGSKYTQICSLLFVTGGCSGCSDGTSWFNQVSNGRFLREGKGQNDPGGNTIVGKNNTDSKGNPNKGNKRKAIPTNDEFWEVYASAAESTDWKVISLEEVDVESGT